MRQSGKISDDSNFEIPPQTNKYSLTAGFETNPETRHVLEITEKLADFVIETDTDLSSMPTDTENSSLPTESELEGETTETDRESTGSVIDK